jgi:hypothetical protein
MSLSSTDDGLDPAKAYLAFDALLDRVRPHIASASRSLCGYSREAVERRLVQRVVELSATPYIDVASVAHGQSGKLPSADQRLLLGGVRICRGHVGVTPLTWLRGAIDFCGQWMRALLALVQPFGMYSGERRSATILLGIGPGDVAPCGSDARFAAFCQSGPLNPLSGASHTVVQYAGSLTSTCPDRISYARHPLLAVMRSNPPRGLDRLRAVGLHLRVAVVFLMACISRPLTCLLVRDMAMHAVAADLNRRGALQSVVLTNSLFQSQALWMRALPERQFLTHMAWYSQNTRPFVFRRDGVRADLPHYRHVDVDVHWVWTEGYADFLRGLGTRAEVRVVGPVLWYLPESSEAETSGLRVAIFDVTPVREAFARKIGLPRNYYATANMIEFLERATLAAERVAERLGHAIDVVLKHKRGYGDVHDPRYIKYVDELEAIGRIRLVPPDTNLYSLIGSSSAIVVIPYSSPAYVASELGVSAIYFDATAVIQDTHEPAPFVDFAAGESSLFEKLCAALRKPQAHARHG